MITWSECVSTIHCKEDPRVSIRFTANDYTICKDGKPVIELRMAGSEYAIGGLSKAMLLAEEYVKEDMEASGATA